MSPSRDKLPEVSAAFVIAFMPCISCILIYILQGLSVLEDI